VLAIGQLIGDKKINKQEFSLDDVYAFTKSLKAKYPAKVRQTSILER